jgi:molybdopterin/thiamine biosynthesis adenylyltransferase
MAHLFQLGAGSGGMAVLDLLCHESGITAITLVEPDTYHAHNVHRHLFPLASTGQSKAGLAAAWLTERRPDLAVRVLVCDILDPAWQPQIEGVVAQADIGVCAADNEAAKFHWDFLMRRYSKPWTLGEVLSGGIGGFVHWFVPGGPCYGCVASFLQRAVMWEEAKTADYSQPQGQVVETRVPASKMSIHAVASLHAIVTLELLQNGRTYDPGFSSLLFSLARVAGVFDEPFRPHRFRVPRAPDCLICRPGAAGGDSAASPEELDAELDQALARLGEV